MVRFNRAARLGVVTTAIAVAASLTLSGCSSDASNSPNLPSSGCGSIPQLGANDPSGLLKDYSKSIQAGYNGYPLPIQASTWTNFKSTKTSGYNAAIVGQAPSAPAIAVYTKSLVASLQAAGVNIVLNVAPTSPTDVPGQIQMFNQALALKPDVIYFMPAAAEASVQLIAAAKAANIPVIVGLNPVDSPDAVNVVQNNTLQAMESASGIVNAMGGKGDVLEVLGIPGIAVEKNWEAGIEATLKLCPNVTVAGKVTGLFQPPVAQQAVVQWLSTHPTGVSGVLQAGTMGWAIRDAFIKSNVPVPPISDNGASQGMASWALAQKDYKYIGIATPMDPQAKLLAQVGLRILAGAGPKINQIVWSGYYIDNSNLSKVADKTWAISDGTDLSPTGVYFTDAETATFFKNPNLGPQAAK